MPQYRRTLPHIHPHGAHLFLTWRLFGTQPTTPPATLYATPGEAFAAHDRQLDRQATGPRWLNNPEIAQIVAEAIQKGETGKHFYELDAWVIMPNHVHILILPKVPVAVLMQWLKGVTSLAANRILARSGQPFWQAESYDHYVRSTKELQSIRT